MSESLTEEYGALASVADHYNLHHDAELLELLKRSSQELLSRLQATSKLLSSLCTEANAVNGEIDSAVSKMHQASSVKFCEQVVREPKAVTGGDQKRPSAVRITPENYEQVVYPKYWKAIYLGTEAYREDNPDLYHRNLPHVYGSAEYLQRSDCGLGGGTEDSRSSTGNALNDRELDRLTMLPVSQSSEADSLADVLSDVEQEIQQGIAASSGFLPNFQSIMEAALYDDSGDETDRGDG